MADSLTITKSSQELVTIVTIFFHDFFISCEINSSTDFIKMVLTLFHLDVRYFEFAA